MMALQYAKMRFAAHYLKLIESMGQVFPNELSINGMELIRAEGKGAV
jgi:hypothetical protein